MKNTLVSQYQKQKFTTLESPYRDLYDEDLKLLP